MRVRRICANIMPAPSLCCLPARTRRAGQAGLRCKAHTNIIGYVVNCLCCNRGHHSASGPPCPVTTRTSSRGSTPLHCNHANTRFVGSCGRCRGCPGLASAAAHDAASMRPRIADGMRRRQPHRPASCTSLLDQPHGPVAAAAPVSPPPAGPYQRCGEPRGTAAAALPVMIKLRPAGMSPRCLVALRLCRSSSSSGMWA